MGHGGHVRKQANAAENEGSETVQYQNQKALITGASSGIGEGFARELARRGMSLLLTALPAEQERLEAIQNELVARHGVQVEVVTVDLADPNGPTQLQQAADARSFEPNLLVNSAGIGSGGLFSDLPVDQQTAVVRVNVEAVVALCGLYLPRMVARTQGAIINLASTSAFEPMPYMATYAASKAFVLRFSEALWAENHHRGVRVVAVCPAPVMTRLQHSFDTDTRASEVRKQVTRRYLTVEDVVAASLNGLERDHPTVVLRLPGLKVLYYLSSAVGIFLPRGRWLMLTERLIRWYGSRGASEKG